MMSPRLKDRIAGDEFLEPLIVSMATSLDMRLAHDDVDPVGDALSPAW
jgi:hypothetical protein